MMEPNLRKWHRRLGVTTAIFMATQALTGLVVCAGTFVSGSWPDILAASIHHEGGFWGELYRVFLGTAETAVVITGFLVFLKLRARQRHSVSGEAEPPENTSRPAGAAPEPSPADLEPFPVGPSQRASNG
jgi:hypothetical protein